MLSKKKKKTKTQKPKNIFKAANFRAEEMPYWLRALVTLAEDLISIPSSHMKAYSSW